MERESIANIEKAKRTLGEIVYTETPKSTVVAALIEARKLVDTEIRKLQGTQEIRLVSCGSRRIYVIKVLRRYTWMSSLFDSKSFTDRVMAEGPQTITMSDIQNPEWMDDLAKALREAGATVEGDY